MGDWDPFTTKVGDVYDRTGRRIGAIRSREVPGSTMAVFYLGVIAAVIATVVYGAISGFQSLGNLIAHGEFTTRTFEATVRDHLDDPAYFTRRAAAARLAISPARVFFRAEGPRAGSTGPANRPWATFTVTNDSAYPHHVHVSRVRIQVALDGRATAIYLKCNLDPGTDFVVPASSKVDAAGIACDIGQYSGPVTVLAQPIIYAVDELPLKGGPANTKWCSSYIDGDERFRMHFVDRCDSSKREPLPPLDDGATTGPGPLAAGLKQPLRVFSASEGGSSTGEYVATVRDVWVSKAKTTFTVSFDARGPDDLLWPGSACVESPTGLHLPPTRISLTINEAGHYAGQLDFPLTSAGEYLFRYGCASSTYSRVAVLSAA